MALLLLDMASQYTLSIANSHSYAYIPFTLSQYNFLTYTLTWMLYNTLHLYINPIYKITKSATIQVNTNITKSAQMKTLKL